jgi:hypothetical protein
VGLSVGPFDGGRFGSELLGASLGASIAVIILTPTSRIVREGEGTETAGNDNASAFQLPLIG